ncbi:MAG TPA: cupin domain-containing protein [Herpetosiphonaceae bacterium]
MTASTIILGGTTTPDSQRQISATGRSFDIHEWSGSGPEYLHVHYADDEAWHILEGTLTFRLIDREVEAPAGTTVFIPAGVEHTYYEAHGPTRYLIIMPPNLRNLVTALHAAPYDQHPAIMQQFNSGIVE